MKGKRMGFFLPSSSTFFFFFYKTENQEKAKRNHLDLDLETPIFNFFASLSSCADSELSGVDACTRFFVSCGLFTTLSIISPKADPIFSQTLSFLSILASFVSSSVILPLSVTPLLSESVVSLATRGVANSSSRICFRALVVPIFLIS